MPSALATSVMAASRGDVEIAVGNVVGSNIYNCLGILGASAIPGFPPAHVPLWAIALGFGFAAMVGIFFGTYPAAKASTLDPIEALRHE